MANLVGQTVFNGHKNRKYSLESFLTLTGKEQCINTTGKLYIVQISLAHCEETYCTDIPSLKTNGHADKQTYSNGRLLNIKTKIATAAADIILFVFSKFGEVSLNTLEQLVSEFMVTEVSIMAW